MKLVFKTEINRSFLEIKSKFNRNLFVALKPPLVKLVINRFDGSSPGDEIHLDLNTMGINQKWTSIITQETQTDKEWSFVDEGKIMPWPLASWRHHHKVIFSGDNVSIIIDDINFECTHSWMNIFMYPALWFTFAIRPSRYKKFFRGD